MFSLGSAWRLHQAAVVGRNVPFVGVQRPALNLKPIEVGRSRAVFQQVIELIEAAAGMVEHAVDDDPDAAAMGFI